jgi:hypothetical protein
MMIAILLWCMAGQQSVDRAAAVDDAVDDVVDRSVDDVVVL